MKINDKTKEITIPITMFQELQRKEIELGEIKRKKPRDYYVKIDSQTVIIIKADEATSSGLFYLEGRIVALFNDVIFFAEGLEGSTLKDGEAQE